MTNIKTERDSNRKLWLDALRGVAMILVVYGHCVQGWTEFFVFTNPVKMPLFFVISAYLFKPRSGDSKVFFKNLFLKLVVPWMVLGMFPYTHPKETFINLISGNTAWFMPCLIIAETIWFYINKISKSLIQFVVLGLVVTTIGFVMNHYHLLRVVINTAFVVQAFFVLGLLVKTYEQEITAKWKLTIPVLGLVYLVMGGATLWLWPGRNIDVHLNKYYNIPFCALIIVVGCVLLFTLFKKCRISPRWLVYIGQNTLLIYLLHWHCVVAFTQISKLLPQWSLPMSIQGLLQATFAIVVCCLLSFIINKYVPEAVGKKRKVKIKHY